MVRVRRDEARGWQSGKAPPQVEAFQPCLPCRAACPPSVLGAQPARPAPAAEHPPVKASSSSMREAWARLYTPVFSRRSSRPAVNTSTRLRGRGSRTGLGGWLGKRLHQLAGSRCRWGTHRGPANRQERPTGTAREVSARRPRGHWLLALLPALAGRLQAPAGQHGSRAAGLQPHLDWNCWGKE